MLIAGGDNRAGLALARSLARHGISLIAVGRGADLAIRSRFVRHGLVSPSPSEDPTGYFQFIRELVERHGIKLVVPMSDPNLVVLERHRSDLESLTTLAMARSDSLRGAVDKRVNLDIAREIGIPCPKQYDLQNENDIPDMIKYLGFPIVLKSPGLALTAGDPRFRFRVLYARNEAELRGHIATHCHDGSYPLFQECAVGKVHNYCCFAAKGEAIAGHEYHSIRRNGGLGVLRKIIQPTPEVERHAKEMLRALEWDGVAHIAFFISDDGRMWYMETNGRFWGSVQGSVNAGWDFPLWVYRYFTQGAVPDPGPIDLGSMTCWHAGDLEGLLDYYDGGLVPATGTHPGRFRATLQYFSGFRPGIKNDVFRWRDPMPAVVEHWRLVQMWNQRMRRRLRKHRKS